MSQTADELLLLRAKTLLARKNKDQQVPSQYSVFLSTALECHNRMLEESDLNRAVALAIAGADLLQTLQNQRSHEFDIPEWVTVHEEQCCRYGAIWIHALQQQGHSLIPDLCQRGVALLQRLQELHPEPLPWIGNMRQVLEQSIPYLPTVAEGKKLHLVVVGNCQAHPLTLGLMQALPQARIYATPSVQIATAEDVAHLHQWINDTDLLVMHRVQPGYRNDIGLDLVTLASLLPPSARSVVLPNLHYEGHHPWIGYAQDQDGRLSGLEDESPLGPYHDFLAMVAARDDLPLEHLLGSPCPIATLDQLRAHHQYSLEELATREKDCDLAISDWIGSNHRQLPIAHTINHPTQAALDQLLRQLLLNLGLPHELSENLFDATEHLGALTIPVHPWVRQALGLEAWADSWGQRQGEPLPIEKQLEESIAFYKQYPWILEVNSQHPKLKLAKLLCERPSIPVPLTPQLTESTSSHQTIYDCIWVSNSPLQSLLSLGKSALAHLPSDPSLFQKLVEAASLTREPYLITQALEKLASHPPAEPWRSHFELQLHEALGTTPRELRKLARHAFQCHQSLNQPWDEFSWRPIAILLHNDEDLEIRANLLTLLSSKAKLELSCYYGNNSDPQHILQAHGKIPREDAMRAATLYSHCLPSLRRPFSHWADPQAADHSVLDALINRINQAKQQKCGFSLVRLGDGEGLFLCGQRPDIGGATSNGSLIDKRLADQGNCLEDPEHELMRRRLAAAIANSDWIGIPDLQQCLTGPIDCVSVASGLNLMLDTDQLQRTSAHLVTGGWHIHNYLLQAGRLNCAPFDSVQAVIAPSLPLLLQDKEDLVWLKIPGEAVFRHDAFGSEAHYPRVFEQTLLAIEQQIMPGDLVLVGAGILGKIYCEMVRQRGGVAVDIGSVIDLSSGHGGTRGEYRMHPWLHLEAKKAFLQLK